MSFFLYTNEATEEGVDLGDPLRLLSGFKEMAMLAGEEAKNYPQLFGVPLSGEQEVLPEWLAAVRQQATAYLTRFGGRLTEYTKSILGDLVKEQDSNGRSVPPVVGAGDQPARDDGGDAGVHVRA